MKRWGDGYPCVLQVLPALETGGGGVERSAIDVAGALVASGGHSLVASAGGAQVRELARAAATHIELPLKSKSPLVMRGNVDRLEQVIKDNDVDVVHARSRAPAWSALAAAHRTGRVFVTTFHGTYNVGNPLKRFYNSVMTRGDMVIANSRFIAEHMQHAYRLAAERIRVIPRGVDTAIYTPDAVSSSRVIQLAKSWSLPDDASVVMLPGRLTRWKGHRLLIDAVEAIADLEFICIFVGAARRDAYRRELENQIRRRGLESKIWIKDHCSDMAAAYMLADVVVSASTDPEAFGRVVAEAQAMGRVTVAPAHGAAVEQIRSGETGFLFQPRDVEALARTLETALTLSGDQRRHIAQAAATSARERYSKDRMCRDTLALYAELLDVHEAAAAQ